MTDQPKAISRAAVWSALDYVIERVVNFLVIVILARLLTPGEFGTVALLTIFVALATVLSESGLAHALIQRQDITDTDKSTVFWMNLALSITAAAILGLISPNIAHFFGVPDLVPLAWLMGLSIILAAFGVVQRALLIRRVAMKRVLLARSIATAVAGTIAILLALRGYGAFAIAAQSCALAGVSSLLFWFFGKWRPALVFDRGSASKMLHFGGFLMLGGCLDALYSRAYTVLVGKMSGPGTMGQYARADSTLILVGGLVTYPLGQVIFPVLSRAQDSPEAMRSAYGFALRTAMLVNATGMLGLIAVAEPFIDVAYGSQWKLTIPVLQILCLGGLFLPLHILNFQLLTSRGRTDHYLGLELVKRGAGIAILIASTSWGILGVAWGTVAAAALAFCMNAVVARRLIGFGFIALLRACLPAAAIGVGVYAVSSAAVNEAAALSPVLQLLIGAGGGGVVFLLGAAAMYRLGLLRDPQSEVSASR